MSEYFVAIPTDEFFYRDRSILVSWFKFCKQKGAKYTGFFHFAACYSYEEAARIALDLGDAFPVSTKEVYLLETKDAFYEYMTQRRTAFIRAKRIKKHLESS